jgi:hypothetical protein
MQMLYPTELRAHTENQALASAVFGAPQIVPQNRTPLNEEWESRSSEHDENRTTDRQTERVGADQVSEAFPLCAIGNDLRTVQDQGQAGTKESEDQVASRIVCKSGERVTGPVLVHTVKDAKEDSFTATSSGKGTHGANATTHFHKKPFDHVGGAKSFPMSF